MPLVMLVPIAIVMFACGYLLQAGLINAFITRPEHSQFLLLVAIAIHITTSLLVGLLYGTMLPMLPRVNPVMLAISLSFIVSYFAASFFLHARQALRARRS